MSKLVTIYGGSGFVGRYVARRMAKAGWRVRVAVRRPNEAMFVRPYGVVGQVEPVLCNIRDDASVALAMAETGHFLRGDKLITLAADKGSPELPYLARRKYDGAAYSMTLDLDEAEGEQSGEETSDYPATLTIRDASEQVVYRKSGIAQCGA